MFETRATGQNILHFDFYLISSQHLKVWWPPSSVFNNLFVPNSFQCSHKARDKPHNAVQGMKRDKE